MKLNIAALALGLAISVSSVGAGLATASGEAVVVETNDPPSIHDVIVSSAGAAWAAEAQFGGEAVGISGQIRNGQLLYDVTLLKADGVTHVWMDANGERMDKSVMSGIDDNPHVERDAKRNRKLGDEEGGPGPGEA